MKEMNIYNLNQIKLFVYDFDGVMTNNKFTLDVHGNEQVSLNRSDGLAISMLKEIGYKQLIMSTENSQLVALRAKKLGIDYLIGIENKFDELRKYVSSLHLKFSQVAYVGNDTNDFEAMNLVHLRICPKDAQNSIKEICHLVLDKNGGEGVIREILFRLNGV